jgi:hypothetical protein
MGKWPKRTVTISKCVGRQQFDTAKLMYIEQLHTLLRPFLLRDQRNGVFTAWTGW